jgi:hypothetical protein
MWSELKDEEIWNKVLLTIHQGDYIRFKNGKVRWFVRLKGKDKRGNYLYLLRNIVHTVNKTVRWNVPWTEITSKIVYEGTDEYRNLRIVESCQ